jgi:hypothetical protein
LIIALIIALIVPAWLPGSAQSLSLNRHRSPNVVRGIEALQDAAIARRLLRRNPKRHGGDAIASTDAKGKGARAGALRERAKTSALPVEKLDAATVPVATLNKALLPAPPSL